MTDIGQDPTDYFVQPLAIILCGIPASGKTTYSDNLPFSFMSLSRDAIRDKLFGKKYKMSKEGEQHVTDSFNNHFEYFTKYNDNIVIDNTHCREKYLDEVIEKLQSKHYRIYIKRFDTPVWLCRIREVKRRFFTGKKVPHSVIKNMHKNYKQINWDKYKKYIL